MLKFTEDFSTDPDPLVGSASRIGPKMDLDPVRLVLNSCLQLTCEVSQIIGTWYTAVAYPGGMHRMHVHPPPRASPPGHVHPPPRPCASPPAPA